MKCESKKTMELYLTLDSSETLMFTKGGKHTFTLSLQMLSDLSDMWMKSNVLLYDDELENLKSNVNITIQMERDEQGRFDFVTNKQE